MKRREFLKATGAGAAALSLEELFSGLAGAQSGADRPNILWLDTENMCPELGCYGHPLVHTPRIDKLAAEGILFEHAYTTAPVCSASRSAINTGMYQTTIGAHHHRSKRDTPLSDLTDIPVRPMSYYLRKAGYFTCNGTALHRGRRGKLDLNWKISHGEMFDGTHWNQCPDGKPFFAQLHFHETHRDYVADPSHPVDPNDVAIPPYYPDHRLTRLVWALYLETMQILDRKVGRVLDRLEEAGLAENTVVFFMGDNGRDMVRGLQFCYDPGLHVPLVVRWPGKIEPGSVRTDQVSGIDLAPTWLRIAGVEPPEHMQGRDLFSSRGREYVYAARDRCDETDDRIRAVRTKRFKYLRNFRPMRPYMQQNTWKTQKFPIWTLLKVLHERGELTPEQEHFAAPHRPVEELYDLKKDPHEVHNLAGKADYEDQLAKMRDKLDEWIYKTNDQGQIPESPEARLKWDRRFEKAWQTRLVDKLGYSPNEHPERYLDYWLKRLEKVKSQSNV